MYHKTTEQKTILVTSNKKYYVYAIIKHETISREVEIQIRPVKHHGHPEESKNFVFQDDGSVETLDRWEEVAKTILASVKVLREELKTIPLEEKFDLKDSNK